MSTEADTQRQIDEAMHFSDPSNANAVARDQEAFKGLGFDRGNDGGTDTQVDDPPELIDDRSIEDAVFKSDKENVRKVLNDKNEYQKVFKKPVDAKPRDYTEEEQRTFMKVARSMGLVDENGRFFGNYKDVDALRKSWKEKNRMIRMRAEQFGAIKPEELSNHIQQEQDERHTPGSPPVQDSRPNASTQAPTNPNGTQPDPSKAHAPAATREDTEATVQSWMNDPANKALWDPTEMIQRRFGAEFVEAGFLKADGTPAIPQTPEEWRKLRYDDPGLYADCRAILQEAEVKKGQLQAFGRQALEALEVRRTALPAHEEELVNADLGKLESMYGIEDAEFLQQKYDELLAMRESVDPRYFEDEFHTGIPVLREGAFVRFLQDTANEALLEAHSNRILRDREQKRDQHYRGKVASAPAFTKSAVNARDRGHQRDGDRMAPPVTPDQWKSEQWRDAYMAKHGNAGMKRIRDYIESLPPAQRARFRD